MALPSLLISSLEQSGIRRVMTRAAEFPDAIHLEVGEPGFVTPRHITDAAHQAALDGFTGYTADVGLSSLRDALAQAATFYHGDETFPEEICVTVGGIGALFGGIRAVVDTDDEVLIPDPGWPNYAMVVEAAAARPVRYPLRAENHYLPDIDEIEAMLSERTHALIINSPSNPLGTVFPERLMQELVELTRRRDLWLISDEVYHRLLFEGEHNSAWRFHSGGRLIVVGSFSKTYAMTGWRVGYALAPPPVIELYAKIQEATVSNAATPSQKAAEAALLGPQDCVQAMLATYTRNREVVILCTQGVADRPRRRGLHDHRVVGPSRIGNQHLVVGVHHSATPLPKRRPSTTATRPSPKRSA